MNKKFSTLVAMLLASGGLFYAVDAMVLPGSEGVAKYVMVETRAGAVAEDYSVTIAPITGEDLATATVWTVDATTTSDSYYLKTDKGSYLAKSADGNSIILAKAGSVAVDLYLKVTIADDLVKVGDQFLVIKEGKLQLANASGAGAVSLFKVDGSALDAIANASTTKFAVAEAGVGYAEFAESKNSSVKATTTVAQSGIAVNTANYGQSTVVSLVKPVGYSNYVLSVGGGLYLQKKVNEDVIEFVTAEALVEELAAVAADENGVITIGGIQLAVSSSGVAYAASGKTYITKVAQDELNANGVLKSDDLAGEVTNNDDMRLATVANLASLTGADYALKVTNSSALTYVSDAAFDAATKWTYDATNKTLGNAGFNLKAAEAVTDKDVTAVYGDNTADVTAITLDQDGAVKIAGFYLVDATGIKTAAEPAAEKKLYLYSAAGTIETDLTAVGAKQLVLGTKVAKTVLGDNGITAVTEQDAVAATPGAEIPGMEGVTVDENGVITPANDATSIAAPVEISLDGTNYLAVGKDNKVIKVAKEDLDVNASWILKDGVYMSVALDRAGEDKKYLKYEAVTAASMALRATETPAAGFTLVAKKDASDATFNGTSSAISLDGQSLTGSSMSVSTNAIPEAPAKSGAQALVAKVGSGFYLLSAKDGAFVSESGVTSATNDSKALWKVEESTLANGVVNYSFYHMNGTTKKYLDLDGTVFTASNNIPYYKGVILKTEKGDFVNVDNNGKLVADPSSAAILGLYEVGENKFSADELTIKRGHGFDVIIAVANTPEASTDIKQNPFTGVLTPVDVNYKEATSGNNFYLRNAAGEYIVLDLSATWGGTTENTLNGKNSWNRGYKFTTVSEATFKNEVVNHADKYKYVFSVSHSAGVAAKDSKEALIDIYTGTLDGVGTVFGRLYVAELKNNAEVSYVLTTSYGFVDATKEHYPYVIFGSTNMAKQTDLAKGKFITVSKKTDIAHKLDGFTQVLTVVTDVNNKTTAAFVDVANAVADTLPASQWAVKVAGTNGITLTNREFPAVTYTQFGNGLYTIEDKANDFAVASNLTDTVRIKFHDSVTPYDGYANFDGIDVRDNLFKIGLISPVFGETAYLSENHGTDHQLGFVNDENEATQWTLAKMTSGRHMEKVTKTDTIYVVSTFDIWKDNKWQPKNDTLKITPFYFINSNNGEAIVWGKDAQNTNPSGVNKNPEAYICNPNTTAKLNETAQAFVLKINGKGYNLVAVNYNAYATLNNYTWNTLSEDNLESLNKMYAGVSSDKGITNRDYSYRKTENDIFSITPVAAEMYRKVAMGDTIKFFREDNEADILFEKGYNEGNFLARVNEVQFPKSAPAMFVDTAYVDRANNNRWEYLLVVEPERKISKVECAIEDHPKHYADTTYGRFLVNLIDSANIYNQSQELHNNKYVNSEGYAKLAFVPGYHTHDTLYLDCVKHTVDTISLDRQLNAYGVEKAPRSVAKFAFRIIDQNTKSFVIETQYKKFANKTPNAAYEGAPGYLKWMNDYVVVVPNIKDADVFNMEENYAGDPTANENVTVSGISVAATNGAVIIKGAEGKKVSIVNVLGQSIANTVITSSEATIAAPAGVVVVSVEGEAAVKAIVK